MRMSKIGFLFAWISLALLFKADTKLVIQSPPELVSAVETAFPNGIPYYVANYGDVPFGGSLRGTIYLPSVLENCIYEPLDNNAQMQVNKIVMSSRGDCTFTTKSLNSQAQGAKLAMIADYLDYNTTGRIVPVDDGRGPQVKIPTILIDHKLGKLITDAIIGENKSVSMVVTFETNHKPVSDVTLWLSSNDRRSYILVRQLQPFFKRISNFIKLSVYHPTIVCKNCPETDCFADKQFCVNTGYFGYIVQGYGQAMIRQQLSEEMILQEYPALWWKYMEKYDEECDDIYNFAECSFDVMKKVGIDSDRVNDTIVRSFTVKKVQDKDSGEEKEIVYNQILEKNQQKKIKSGIIVYPGIIVNGITYRGNLQALQIFELVCNSLEEEPAGCKFQTAKAQTPWRYLVIVVIIFFVFMIFLVGCYRRIVRRQLSKNINKEVNDLVNQYITMYEQQRFDEQIELPAAQKTKNNEE